MIIFDAILGIFMLLAIWSGWKKGIVYQVISLIAVFVGIFVASRFWQFTFSLMQKKLDWDVNILKYLSMILTAVIVIAGVVLIGKLLSKLIEVTIFGVMDKVLGALFSLIKIVVVVSFLVYGVNYFFPKNDFFTDEKIKQSYTLPYIEPVAVHIADWMDLESVSKDEWSLPPKEDLDDKNIFTQL
ncbi:MAG: CvpA family protein [Bacteroidales bacterium]|nr:CvpA family protein [Bacteroidales bacterium]